MMNEHSVLDTEVNGSRIGDGTLDLTESTTTNRDEDFESPTVIETAEVSFPSPEELRNSRTSRNSSSSRGIWKGAASSSVKNDPNSTSTITDRSNKTKTCRLYAILIAIVILVFLIIIPAIVVINNNNSKEVNDVTSDESSNAENRPRPTFAEIIDFIVLQNISSDVDILTADSPQYKAAIWLMQDDPANLPVPSLLTSGIDTYDGYRYMTRYIMALNYYALNGPNWGIDINFMSSFDVCDWNKKLLINNKVDDVGVFCINSGFETDAGTIIRRIPSSLQLVAQMDGSIPTENGMLSTLATIQFWGNENLRGNIPTEICSMTNLKGLYMNVNRLSGNIPSCLGNLRNLEILNLGLNEFVGTIPPELCQLTKLESLYLSANLLDGNLPSCLGELPLVYVDLSSNLLTGNVPDEFENLADTLLRISLDDNMLSGDPSNTFNQLVKLDHLTASNNRFNFTMDSTFLANTRNLGFFDMSNNEIEGTFPNHFLTTEYPFLSILDVSKNDLGGDFSNNVSSVASPVVYLGAHDNKMTGSISHLVNLTNLKHLDLSNNQFTGTMETMSVLTNLWNLFLSENSFDAAPIPESFEKLSNLQELSLRNTNLIGPIPELIATNWTFIELIDFGENSLVGPIPDNFGSLTALQYLLLHDNDGINGTIPVGFESMTQLKGVLLDRTSIDGSEALELFCELPNFVNVTGLELFIVDCPEEECSACDGCRCCNEAEPSSCSQPQLGNIDGLWYQGFVRPKNEFNFTDDPNASNRM